MNKTEIIDKIKSFFFNEEEEVVVAPVEPSDWKSGETILRVNGEVAVGTEVLQVTEAGLESVLDGEYPIEDTEMTLVIADGAIAEVKEVPVEMEENEENEDEDKDEKEGYSFSAEDLTNLKAEIGTIIKETFEAIAVEMESVKKENEELKTRFETFASEDADKSVKEGKEKKIKFEDKYEKLRFFGKK